MNRLEIATFTNVFMPSLNGVAVSVESFRKGLEERGHHSIIFAPSADEARKDRFVVRYPAIDLPWQDYPLAVPVSTFADKVFELARPDVIHAHHPAILGRTALEKSEKHQVPLVFTYHTRYHDYAHYAEPLPRERVEDLLTHWLGHYMSYCHHVVVPSRSIEEMLRQRYGIEQNVSVIPTGVDTERFGGVSKREARRRIGRDPEETLLVSAGRLAKEKNFEVLLRALNWLPSELNWKLMILGEGDLRPHLETLVEQLQLQDRVELPGGVPFSEMPLYYAAADLFCFPSITETQGLVTLEAMASRLPVAAVEASGTRDVVEDGVQGLLCENEPEALGRAIEHLLSNPELRRRYAEAARSRAQEFTPGRQAEALESVYYQAIENRDRGASIRPDLRSHWEAFLDFFSTNGQRAS